MKLNQGVLPVRRAGAFLALAFSVMVSLGAFAPGASASMVQPVTIQACTANGGGGCSYTDTVRVDEAFGLNVAFKVTNPLVSGSGKISVRGPAGTVFKPGVVNHVSLNVGLSGYAVPPENVSIANGGLTLSVTVPNYVVPAITSADDLELKIGNFVDQIQVPPVPGSFFAFVFTSADQDSRASNNTITTTVGLPGALELIGDESSARVNTTFSEPIGAKVTDSRGNALGGESVTFTLPGEEAESGGGSFPGEETTFTGTTNAQGIVTTPTITAGQTAGAWGVAVDGPGAIDGTIVLNNTPGPAFEIGVDVDPVELPADGTSTATAEISIADQFGNAITGDDVTIDTGGGPTATPPVVSGDVYTSTLTASQAPGTYVIRATDTSAIPDLSGEFEFEQTVPPPTAITLELSPASIPANGTSQSTATVKVVSDSTVPIPDLELEIESDGDQAIDTPVPGPNNTYTAKILSTAVPGVATITATLVAGDLEFSASAGLTQSTPVGPPTPPSPPPPPPKVVKPVIKIKSGPKGKTRKGKVRFKFVVTKGKAVSFQCRLDKKKWKKCRSPKTVKVKPGRHLFQVRGIGTDGEHGKAAKRRFKRIG